MISSVEIERITFPVAGMTCSSCVNRIGRAVRRVEGVRGVQVDLRAETVTVRREQGRAADAALAAAVTDAGYEPDIATATVAVDDGRRGLLDRLLRR